MLLADALAFVLAQANGPGQSILWWAVSALGDASGFWVVVSSAWIFWGAWYRVSSKQPPAALAAYMALLPLPALISVCGTLKGMISALMVIGATANIEITSTDIAAGVAVDLFHLLAALWLTAPSYFLLAYGLTTRTLLPPGQGMQTAPVETPALRPELHPA